MASRRRSGPSSPLDEMLEKTRKQFADLDEGAAPRWPGSSGKPPAAPARGRRTERYAPRPSGAPPAHPAPAPQSAATPSQETAAQEAPPQNAEARAPGPAAGFDAVSMDPARFLDDRFGDGWRHEITDRRRDGEDVVVRCRLSIDGAGLSQTQMGRARIYAAGEVTEIAASAGGVAFSFRATAAPSGNGAAEAEAAAYRQAERVALARCVELLGSQ